MLACALLEVQSFGSHTGATRIRVCRIPRQLIGFFEALGYCIEVKKRLLYAVRDITAPMTR